MCTATVSQFIPPSKQTTENKRNQFKRKEIKRNQTKSKERKETKLNRGGISFDELCMEIKP